MQGISKTIVGTDITQFEMTAQTALDIGLLTDGAGGAKWFAEWAKTSPTDLVYAYTFGGIFGGFIYGDNGGEVADFNTLAEFADCANDGAMRIWAELQAAWEDRLLEAAQAAYEAAQGPEFPRGEFPC